MPWFNELNPLAITTSDQEIVDLTTIEGRAKFVFYRERYIVFELIRRGHWRGPLPPQKGYVRYGKALLPQKGYVHYSFRVPCLERLNEEVSSPSMAW